MDKKQKTSTDQWYAAKKRQWAREERIAKFKRLFGDKPRQYKHIPVPDWDKRTQELSSFRQAYADFFCTSYYQENSPLQPHSTQLLWHRLYLQKRRMEHLGITLEMESQRVERTKNPRDSIVEVKNFDGRYMVSEVNEAIWSTRTFMQNGQEQGILILGVPSDENITDSGPCILPDYKYISVINSGIHHGITLGIVKKIYKIN